MLRRISVSSDPRGSGGQIQRVPGDRCGVMLHTKSPRLTRVSTSSLSSALYRWFWPKKASFCRNLKRLPMVSWCPGCSTAGRGAGRCPCPRPWGPREAAAAARPGFPGGRVAGELPTWSPGGLRPWAGLSSSALCTPGPPRWRQDPRLPGSAAAALEGSGRHCVVSEL